MSCCNKTNNMASPNRTFTPLRWSVNRPPLTAETVEKETQITLRPFPAISTPRPSRSSSRRRQGFPVRPSPTTPGLDPVHSQTGYLTTETTSALEEAWGLKHLSTEECVAELWRIISLEEQKLESLRRKAIFELADKAWTTKTRLGLQAQQEKLNRTRRVVHGMYVDDSGRVFLDEEDLSLEAYELEFRERLSARLREREEKRGRKEKRREWREGRAVRKEERRKARIERAAAWESHQAAGQEDEVSCSAEKGAEEVLATLKETEKEGIALNDETSGEHLKFADIYNREPSSPSSELEHERTSTSGQQMARIGTDSNKATGSQHAHAEELDRLIRHAGKSTFTCEVIPGQRTHERPSRAKGPRRSVEGSTRLRELARSLDADLDKSGEKPRTQVGTTSTLRTHYRRSPVDADSSETTGSRYLDV